VASYCTNRLRICAQMPDLDQRLKRLYTVVGTPYSAGQSAHRQPVRKTWMMPLRISRLRFGLTPRRFGGTALSIDANCSSLSQNRSAIVLLHVNRGVESGLLETGQALETWELGFEPSIADGRKRVVRGFRQDRCN